MSIISHRYANLVKNSNDSIKSAAEFCDEHASMGWVDKIAPFLLSGILVMRTYNSPINPWQSSVLSERTIILAPSDDINDISNITLHVKYNGLFVAKYFAPSVTGYDTVYDHYGFGGSGPSIHISNTTLYAYENHASMLLSFLNRILYESGRDKSNEYRRICRKIIRTKLKKIIMFSLLWNRNK